MVGEEVFTTLEHVRLCPHIFWSVLVQIAKDDTAALPDLDRLLTNSLQK